MIERNVAIVTGGSAGIEAKTSRPHGRYAWPPAPPRMGWVTSPMADTPMLRAVAGKISSRLETLAHAILMRLLGRGSDVARAVVFFADPGEQIRHRQLLVCGASVGAPFI